MMTLLKTCHFDSCHNGTVIYLPFTCRFAVISLPFDCHLPVILLSSTCHLPAIMTLLFTCHFDCCHNGTVIMALLKTCHFGSCHLPVFVPACADQHRLVQLELCPQWRRAPQALGGHPLHIPDFPFRAGRRRREACPPASLCP